MYVYECTTYRYSSSLVCNVFSHAFQLPTGHKRNKSSLSLPPSPSLSLYSQLCIQLCTQTSTIMYCIHYHSFARISDLHVSLLLAYICTVYTSACLPFHYLFVSTLPPAVRWLAASLPATDTHTATTYSTTGSSPTHTHTHTTTTYSTTGSSPTHTHHIIHFTYAL